MDSQWKTPLKLEEEIKMLLSESKWRGHGPHGQTIRAVMQRVAELRQRITTVRVIRKTG